VSGKLGPIPSRPFTLSWSHYVFLLGVKNPDERSFYEIEACEQNWTFRELKRQYDSGLYERLALSRDKKGIRRLAQQGQTVAQAHDLLKEPLVLEFLGLDERSRYSESDLEAAINSSQGKDLVDGKLVGAAQKHFNVTAAKEALICLPSVPEQGRVVAKVAALRAQTQRLESVCRQKLAALDALKQSLLHQAFTGAL